MITTAPHELWHYTANLGEITLIENPDPYAPRYEVWMTRLDWDQWCRLVATDDRSEAQFVFRKAIAHL
jgi:hypothetical protein